MSASTAASLAALQIFAQTPASGTPAQPAGDISKYAVESICANPFSREKIVVIGNNDATGAKEAIILTNNGKTPVIGDIEHDTGGTICTDVTNLMQGLAKQEQVLYQQKKITQPVYTPTTVFCPTTPGKNTKGQGVFVGRIPASDNAALGKGSAPAIESRGYQPDQDNTDSLFPTMVTAAFVVRDGAVTDHIVDNTTFLQSEQGGTEAIAGLTDILNQGIKADVCGIWPSLERDDNNPVPPADTPDVPLQQQHQPLNPGQVVALQLGRDRVLS